MDLQLTGKTAFISGSTQGIGYATAKALAAEGADVILNGRDPQRLTQAVDRLRREVPGASVSGQPADFAVTEDVDRLCEQRLVELAVALAAQPRVLLLDEPAAGMTGSEKERLVELIRRVREQGVTVFVVEHDMRLVMAVSDTVIVLNHGRVIAEGSPATHEFTPPVHAPVEAQAPNPHDVGKPSTAPSQSLSRLSHSSGCPGATDESPSSQSPAQRLTPSPSPSRPSSTEASQSSSMRLQVSAAP